MNKTTGGKLVVQKRIRRWDVKGVTTVKSFQDALQISTRYINNYILEKCKMRLHL